MKEIVIKIDDKTYNDILIGRIYSSPRDVPQEAIKAIRNGKELPKGHGELKDMKKVKKAVDNLCVYHGINTAFIASIGINLDTVDTLVEADKGEE